jgi:hypothetical protein
MRLATSGLPQLRTFTPCYQHPHFRPKTEVQNIKKGDPKAKPFSKGVEAE